jgi:hypothetical protein
MDINIKLRSQILEYSLTLEEGVNNLLLLNLGVFDGGNSTRLFGKKAGITFKNKIDLLYDIDILSKEENSDLELLMIFRNKFLHDIECNSFLVILEQLDSGIKSKFKMHLNEGQSINDEESCITNCSNLFLKNIRTIKNKVKAIRLKAEEKHEIFQVLNQQIIYNGDLFFDLIHDLCLIIENSELEDTKVRKLGESISKKCEQYVTKYNEDEKIISLNEKSELFFTDIEKIKNYYGITRIDKNKITNYFQDNDLSKRIDDFRK